ncbi:uncharacterized protein METZ01_LOCUS155945, partial [marine metagenome]
MKTNTLLLALMTTAPLLAQENPKALIP